MVRALFARVMPAGTVTDPPMVLAAGAVIAIETPVVLPPLATATPVATPWPL